MDAHVGKLTATQRTKTKKRVTRKMRQQGLVPAVVYGGKEESRVLTVSPLELRAALDATKKENTLIELTIQAEDGSTVAQEAVMLKEHQVDPIKQVLLHADFIRVSREATVRAEVPVELTGRPVGVQLGGVLNLVFRTVPVECTPERIPGKLVIDVSHLDIGDGVVARGVSLPDQVSLCLPDEQTIALVAAPRKVVEEVAEGAEEEGAEEGEAAGGEAGAEATSESKAS